MRSTTLRSQVCQALGLSDSNFTIKRSGVCRHVSLMYSGYPHSEQHRKLTARARLGRPGSPSSTLQVTSQQSDVAVARRNPNVQILLLLLLTWVRAEPDRPFRSQTRLIGRRHQPTKQTNQMRESEENTYWHSIYWDAVLSHSHVGCGTGSPSQAGPNSSVPKGTAGAVMCQTNHCFHSTLVGTQHI
jgi:hypothetical protein